MSTPLYMELSEKCIQASKDQNIPHGSKNPNIPLNVCKYSTEKTYSTRNTGTQTVRKCCSESSTLLPDHKTKISCRHRGLNPRRMFCAKLIQLLSQLYYLVVKVKSESCIRNQNTQSITHSCFLPVWQLLLFYLVLKLYSNSMVKQSRN